ncbi:hypothetical protein CW745_12535 [Psychromonas sp. psych-6C06]|uniref:DUF642 domain-containing protein n=1 Tax=Psychromonas sp. psych-6C06 TaxID=2058089 RepID=UPI000C336EC9|nr:DUF642 domain-containing protein [Psychromonas sp. psych-6C06]PKF61123.1 hypothetical protein CW745_12535 [Psychromonas sp. psych-6C06]
MINTFKNTALALLLGTMATVAHSTVMFEDDFNSYQEGTYTTTIGSNWKVNKGSIDIVAPGGSWESLNQPGYMGFVDLDGSTGESGKIVSSDKFFFELNMNYQLTFDLAGDQRNDGENRARSFITTVDGISGNNLLSNLITLDSNASFDTYSYSFVGTGVEGRIGFNARGGNNDDDNIGLLLDNVQLASVPAPSGLALFAMVLLGLGWSRRKFSA